MTAKFLRDGFSRLSTGLRALNAAPWFRLLFPAALVAFVSGPLVFVIFFTALEWQWLAFLSGILFSAFVALASRASQAEWRNMSLSSQLFQTRDSLSREIARHQDLETALKEAEDKLVLLDRELPAMLAYVDAEQRYRFHNQAFGHWVNLPPARINGRLMSEVLGRRAFSAIEEQVTRVLAGEQVQWERSETTPEGRVFRYSELYLPRFGEGAKVAGFYTLSVDVTQREDIGHGKVRGLSDEARGKMARRVRHALC